MATLSEEDIAGLRSLAEKVTTLEGRVTNAEAANQRTNDSANRLVSALRDEFT